MEGKEDEENIFFAGKKNSKILYPAKGRFTKEQLKFAKFVKKAFGDEHMWVKIKTLEEDHLLGTVDNVPYYPESPKRGTEVRVKYQEIEDAR